MNSKQMGFFGATVDNNWKHSSSGISISSPPSTAVMMRKTIKPVIEWFSTAQITIMWNEHDENTLPQLHKILINLPHAKDLSVRACRWAQQKGIGAHNTSLPARRLHCPIDLEDNPTSSLSQFSSFSHFLDEQKRSPSRISRSAKLSILPQLSGKKIVLSIAWRPFPPQVPRTSGQSARFHRPDNCSTGADTCARLAFSSASSF